MPDSFISAIPPIPRMRTGMKAWGGRGKSPRREGGLLGDKKTSKPKTFLVVYLFFFTQKEKKRKKNWNFFPIKKADLLITGYEIIKFSKLNYFIFI